MGSSCTQGQGSTYSTIITELIRLRNCKESGQLKEGEGISSARSEIWLLALAVLGMDPSITGLPSWNRPKQPSLGFPGGSVVKNPPAMQENQV